MGELMLPDPHPWAKQWLNTFAKDLRNDNRRAVTKYAQLVARLVADRGKADPKRGFNVYPVWRLCEGCSLVEWHVLVATMARLGIGDEGVEELAKVGKWRKWKTPSGMVWVDRQEVAATIKGLMMAGDGATVESGSLPEVGEEAKRRAISEMGHDVSSQPADFEAMAEALEYSAKMFKKAKAAAIKDQEKRNGK